MTRWLWTAPSGLVTELSAWNAGNYVTDVGTQGQLAPEYDFAVQELAGVDGATLLDVSAQPGAPVLGLDLVASDGDELRARVRALAHAFRPRAGIGTLTAEAADGTTRRLPCYYRKGLESGVYRVTRYRTAVHFWAPSPWWRGTPLAYEWSLAGGSPFFPILPMRLSASTISGSVTLDLSDTDAPTYPTWIVTGPGTELTLTRGNQSLVLPAAFGDGQHVRIVTAPAAQAINRVTLNPDGTVAAVGESLFGNLATDPAMWPLLDDVNEVTAVLANAGPASRIRLTADRLYSGAL